MIVSDNVYAALQPTQIGSIRPRASVHGYRIGIYSNRKTVAQLHSLCTSVEGPAIKLLKNWLKHKRRLLFSGHSVYACNATNSGAFRSRKFPV